MVDPDRLGIEPEIAIDSYGVAGDGRLPRLDLRGHDGTSLALPYAQLRSVAFDPAGISLEFPDHRVRVKGRNLRSLYDLLLAHQVTFVQEGDLDVVSESATFIDKIVVERAEELP